MKVLFILLSISVLFLFSSCEDDNSTEPQLSIIEQINNARPLYSIMVFDADNGNLKFGINDHPFTNAYAENGYLVVTGGSSTHYFNLSLAKQVYIYEHAIQLDY